MKLFHSASMHLVGIIGFFFLVLLITVSHIRLLPSSPAVLGATNKRVASILIDGKEWNYKEGYRDFEFQGIEGQPNFYPLPITIRYTDGSSRMVHLGFQYLK